MLSGIPGLRSLDASSAHTPIIQELWQPEPSADLAKYPLQANHPQMRTTDLDSPEKSSMKRTGTKCSYAGWSILSFGQPSLAFGVGGEVVNKCLHLETRMTVHVGQAGPSSTPAS